MTRSLGSVLRWKNDVWRRQTRVFGILLLQVVLWVGFVALGVTLKGKTYPYRCDVSGVAVEVIHPRPMRLHVTRDPRTDEDLFLE